MPEKLLSKERFEAAQRMIESQARPLERARFRQAFEGGSAEAVFDALGEFQNADGGFGNALEPDLRSPASSALGTSIAFQILRGTPGEPDPALLNGAISYLLKTLDRETGHWRIIPPAANESPHAPWWNQEGREEAFDAFSLNPSAELLGYLYEHEARVSVEVIDLVKEQVISHLLSQEKLEMHELLCCVRLMETMALPPDLRSILEEKMPQFIDAAVAYDPAEWEGYGLRPLQVIPGPDSPFLAGREAAVAANLDFEIASQQDDGSWGPPWSWGEAYPDDWALARREWMGVITLGQLLLLRNYDRFEPDP